MTHELLDDLKKNHGHDLSEEAFLGWLEKLKDNPDMLLTMPNNARWWCTTMADDRLMRNLHLWKKLAKEYVNQSDLTPVDRDILVYFGGSFVSLLNKPPRSWLILHSLLASSVFIFCLISSSFQGVSIPILVGQVGCRFMW